MKSRLWRLKESLNKSTIDYKIAEEIKKSPGMYYNLLLCRGYFDITIDNKVYRITRKDLSKKIVKMNYKLEAFLYLLMRDELPYDTIKQIINTVNNTDDSFEFTNTNLAEMAKKYADLLR